MRHQDRRCHAADGAAKRSAACLAGRDARCEFRTADRAADEIGADVGRPDRREQEQDGYQPGARLFPQQAERDAGKPGIGDAAGRPTVLLAEPPEQPGERHRDGGKPEDRDSRDSQDERDKDHREQQRRAPLLPAQRGSAGHGAPFVEDPGGDCRGKQPERQAAGKRQRHHHDHQHHRRDDAQLQVAHRAAPRRNWALTRRCRARGRRRSAVRAPRTGEAHRQDGRR